jgi:hypothetical protein
MRDTFRPTFHPAQAIYDAFQAESKKRDGRSVPEWTKAERDVVWATARDHAQQLGLRVPTMAEVESAERNACGHIDYGAKWAYGVAEAMRQAA